MYSAALALVLSQCRAAALRGRRGRRPHTSRRVQDRFSTLGSDVLEFWRWATAPKNRRYVELVFEIHGLAPRNPQMYGGYVGEAIESWTSILISRGHKQIAATAFVAVFDGLLMDYLATGDRGRTTRALKLFMKKIGGTP